MIQKSVGFKLIKFTIFIIISIAFFSVAKSQTSQEAEPGQPMQVVKYNNCELFSGHYVNNDFKLTKSSTGPVNDEHLGSVQINVNSLVTEKKGIKVYSFQLYNNTGDRLLGEVGSTFLADEDYISMIGITGFYIRMRRVYKNEWYGSYVTSQHREDSHVIFVQPIKCTIN